MEKTLAYFFVLSDMKNNRELFIRNHTVFWQILCKLEDLCLKTKEMVKKSSKKIIFTVKKKKLPSFFQYCGTKPKQKNNL